MNATDVQRYKRLLLAKRDELTKRNTAGSPAPELTCREIEAIKQAPTPKQTRTFGCVKLTFNSCVRLKTL